MSHPERNKISYLTRWFRLSAIVAMLVAPVFLPSVNLVFAAPYLNSAEPMCNGSDPTVLMCDDFEDGTWYVTNSNTAGGINNPDNDGWGGGIFADDDNGNGHARCGSLGAVGTNCVATTGFRSGANYQAKHGFAPNLTKYGEIYHRFYVKFLSGYQFGHEKLVTYLDHHGATDQQTAILMTPFGSGQFDVDLWAVTGTRQLQNQGNNLTFIPGRWYYVEVHIKLDNPEGSGNGSVLEVWADDCGTNGMGCTGPGTLRMRYLGLPTRSSGGLLGIIWQENWSPQGDATGEVYNDQVVVRTQRIGPMGVMQPPTNLQVQ